MSLTVYSSRLYWLWLERELVNNLKCTGWHCRHPQCKLLFTIAVLCLCSARGNIQTCICQIRLFELLIQLLQVLVVCCNSLQPNPRLSTHVAAAYAWHSAAWYHGVMLCGCRLSLPPHEVQGVTPLCNACLRDFMQA